MFVCVCVCVCMRPYVWAHVKYFCMPSLSSGLVAYTDCQTSDWSSFNRNFVNLINDGHLEFVRYLTHCSAPHVLWNKTGEAHKTIYFYGQWTFVRKNGGQLFLSYFSVKLGRLSLIGTCFSLTTCVCLMRTAPTLFPHPIVRSWIVPHSNIVMNVLQTFLRQKLYAHLRLGQLFTWCHLTGHHAHITTTIGYLVLAYAHPRLLPSN